MWNERNGMQICDKERSQHIKWNGENDLKITKIKITVTEEDVAPSEDTNVNMNTRRLM